MHAYEYDQEFKKRNQIGGEVDHYDDDRDEDEDDVEKGRQA